MDREVSSHEDSGFQLVSFVVLCFVVLSFVVLGFKTTTKICTRFVSKAIKLLLTELVGQCRNILPLAFSPLTPLRSVNTKKAGGNIILH